MFQPGMLNVLEQQLVGPNGGEPLSFQKDLFGPLGDRITLISDFKKPIKEDSQRMLLGVALEDAKAFQNTLNKLIDLAGGVAQEAGVPGDDDLRLRAPRHAQRRRPPGNIQTFKGPISLAIAKDTLFVATEPTLLEQVLRGGGSPLADSSDLPGRRQGDPRARSAA